jgi:hypothetical protein
MSDRDSKFRSRTSWRAKLERLQEPKVVTIPPKMAARFGEGTMLIPCPLDVDALVRKVRKGKLVTVRQIRESLARAHGATVTCPLTTGIFLRIAAEAAEEDRHLGRKTITPYWRVVRDDGTLNEKFPGGARSQAAHLRSEGLRIEPPRGKKPPRVADFAASLVAF